MAEQIDLEQRERLPKPYRISVLLKLAAAAPIGGVVLGSIALGFDDEAPANISYRQQTKQKSQPDRMADRNSGSGQ